MDWCNLEEEGNSLLVWSDSTEDHRRWHSLLKTPYHHCQLIPSVVPLLPGGDNWNNKVITLFCGQLVGPQIRPCRVSVGELDGHNALQGVRFGTSQAAGCMNQPFVFLFRGKVQSCGDHACGDEPEGGHSDAAKPGEVAEAIGVLHSTHNAKTGAKGSAIELQ